MNFLLAILLTLPFMHEAPVFHQCRLVFAGDMMQHKAQIESAYRDSQSYRYDDCFTEIHNLVEEADYAVCNLEAPLGGSPYTGYPSFSAPDEFAEAISETGFDLCLTANNHCMDKGKRGLIRTLDALDSMNIRHIGTYRNQAERDSLYPAIENINGISTVFLNYTYGTNGNYIPAPCIVNLIDTVQMKTDLEKARQLAPDCIIVCIHWGEEYKLQQNSEQETLAAWLISHGADHIIGAHPHVIQPVEMIKESPEKHADHLVAYSLGNFISNMSARNTDTGLLLELNLARFLSITWLSSHTEIKVKTERPSQSGLPYFRIVRSSL